MPQICIDVLVACTVVGIGWGVTSAVSQQEAPPALLVEELAIATVKQVIATSEGSDAEETQRIRKVLRAIALDQTPPGDAVENVLPRDATLGQKYGLQRRSSVLFTRRMDALIRLLFRFRQSVRLR